MQTTTRSRIALALLLAAPLALAEPPESVVTPPDEASVPQPADVVGWYAAGGEEFARITWRADTWLTPQNTRGYWLVLLEQQWIDPVNRDAGGTLYWYRTPEERRTLVPQRDVDGFVTGLIWRRENDSDLRLARKPGPYHDSLARFASVDGAEIASTLMMPARATPADPVPGVVIIQGSGESSRDNQWAMTFADAMARAGVAVLYPDKRGSGQSTGVWQGMGFDTLAADAVGAMRTLRADPRVDPARTGFVGLSQGGWIAPLAARELGDTAFNVSVSGTVVTPGEQLRHEVAQDFAREGLSDEQVARLLGVVDLSAEWVRTGKGWGRYLEALDELRADEALAGIAAGFPIDRGVPMLRFMQKVHDYDPAPLWMELGTPALFMYGRLDERDNIPVEETVRRIEAMSRTAPEGTFELEVYEDTGHALFDADTGWVRRDVLKRLVGWIGERTE
jgi:hypothetical protein